MKTYRVSRAVARYKDRCSHCGEDIMPGQCIARMYNYSAHGRSKCEESIVERYEAAVSNAHKARA